MINSHNIIALVKCELSNFKWKIYMWWLFSSLIVIPGINIQLLYYFSFTNYYDKLMGTLVFKSNIMFGYDDT